MKGILIFLTDFSIFVKIKRATLHLHRCHVASTRKKFISHEWNNSLLFLDVHGYLDEKNLVLTCQDKEY